MLDYAAADSQTYSDLTHKETEPEKGSSSVKLKVFRSFDTPNPCPTTLPLRLRRLVPPTLHKYNSPDIAKCRWNTVYVCVVFTALHTVQAGISHEKNVCPFVCPIVFLSIRQTRELWQNEINFCPYFIPSERSIILVFRQEECLVGENPLFLKFCPNWPRSCKNADFQSIFARGASAVTPSERTSIVANRKSTTHFPVSLRWTAYVAPERPVGGGKNAKWPSKLHFTWNSKSATKFLCVNTVCNRVVRH